MGNWKALVILFASMFGLIACGEAEGVSSREDARTYLAAQMKTNASNVRRQVNKSAKACVEKRAKGKIPAYVVKFIGNAVMIGVKYAAKNQHRDLSPDELKKFMKQTEKKLQPRVLRLAKRLVKEKPKVQKRAKRVLSGNVLSGAFMGVCVMRTAMKAMKTA